MGQATDRLRRYLDDELEQCRNEDVERRPDLTVGWEEYTDLMGLPEVKEMERRYSS